MSKGGGSSAFLGMTAYDPTTQLLFVDNPIASSDGSVTSGAIALQVSSVSCKLSIAWQAMYVTSGHPNKTHSSDPVIAGGVAWFVTGPGDSVRAFNETTGAPLWDSGSTMTSATETAAMEAD